MWGALQHEGPQHPARPQQLSGGRGPSVGLAGPSGLVNVEEEGRLRRGEVETGLGSGGRWQAGSQARSWAGRAGLKLVNTSSPRFFPDKGLWTCLGRRPGLKETGLGFAGLTALAQGGGTTLPSGFP